MTVTGPFYNKKRMKKIVPGGMLRLPDTILAIGHLKILINLRHEGEPYRRFKAGNVPHLKNGCYLRRVL
jgi:hypothetical protein